MSALVILDLGYGNVRSVAVAFERLGVSPRLTSDISVADNSGWLVLPGVGAAGAAMARLRETGLDRLVAQRTRPTLGICLGMQLLFEESEEDGGTPLLGLVPGRVTAIAAAPGYPVPHMGWSRVDDPADGIGLKTGDYLYFAHGFACPDERAIAASTDYGGTRIPAALRYGPYWGAQFHPERSSEAGARFLRAFLDS